jgi:hypothetical protein
MVGRTDAGNSNSEAVNHVAFTELMFSTDALTETQILPTRSENALRWACTPVLSTGIGVIDNCV